ncbi:hypothetical protein QVD17_24225 [Tagetes erecta]|uniref:Secreted protein n=1 Tax=Tagetes erecta TaxID=13708 RepID=A0AAD8KHK4_TARER|nr:hypothetical protein QVD17_24225 [Tagetes erecta]
MIADCLLAVSLFGFSFTSSHFGVSFSVSFIETKNLKVLWIKRVKFKAIEILWCSAGLTHGGVDQRKQE